jgi:hypothetical protein
VGGGYSTTRYSVDLVYQYSLSEDRTVTEKGSGSVADGTWQSNCQEIMITTSLKF